MKTYYIDREDLAASKQAELNRRYIEGKNAFTVPEDCKQKHLRKEKFLWNLYIVSMYLLENTGENIYISEMKEDLEDLIVLSYTANRYRNVKDSSILEEIRECIRLIYIDAYAQVPDFTSIPVVVSHGHANYVDSKGFPLERPIREFAPKSKDVDRHATGRVLTGKKDRNPPMIIIPRDFRYLLDYTERLSKGNYTLKTVAQRNAICL
jgi:hypothetical protein